MTIIVITYVVITKPAMETTIAILLLLRMIKLLPIVYAVYSPWFKPVSTNESMRTLYSL